MDSSGRLSIEQINAMFPALGNLIHSEPWMATWKELNVLGMAPAVVPLSCGNIRVLMMPTREQVTVIDGQTLTRLKAGNQATVAAISAGILEAGRLLCQDQD